MAEVLVKVGTNAESKCIDGMVVDVKPNGAYITPVEIAAFFTSGTIPLALRDGSGLPLRHRKMHLFTLKRCQMLTDFTRTALIKEIRKRNQIQGLQGYARIQRVEDLDGNIETAKTMKPKLLSDGLDTNWGYQELRQFVVLRYDDLNENDLLVIAQPDVDESDPVILRMNKHAYRIAWRTLPGMTPEKIAQIEDPTVFVVPDRKTLHNKSTIIYHPAT